MIDKTSMASSIVLFLAILICFSHSTFSLKQCTIPPIIFNFGDSNSDTGRLVAQLNVSTINYPYGRTFGAGSGRLSDGRLIIDFLCQSLNRTLLKPYVSWLEIDTFLNGTDFAVVGSEARPCTTSYNLNVQVGEFKELFNSKSSVLAATGIRNYIGESGFSSGLNMINDIGQNDLISSYSFDDGLSYDQFVENIIPAALEEISRFSSALYSIDIGQNDLSSSFDGGLSYDQVVQNTIPAALEEIRKTIKDIYNRRGRKFWVHNTGPIGCLPQKLATVPQNLDSYGCIASYNDAARVFNQGLFNLTKTLRSELKNSVIVYVDIFAIKLDLIANATQYGFTSPLMACCGDERSPYHYNPNVSCGSPAGYDVCDPESRFVNWDGVHYTEAANEFVAKRILSTDYSTPKITYDFFCRKYYADMISQVY